MLVTADHLPNTTYEQVFESAQARPHPDTDPILIDAVNTDRTLSFEALKMRTRALAVALRGPPYNLNEGDPVAICSPNDIEYLIAIHGVMAAGCAACLMPNVLSTAEITGLIGLAKPKAAIVHAETLDKVVAALEQSGCQVPIWIIGSGTTDSAITPLSDVYMKPTTDALPKVNPDTIAYFVCTSGSTGPRKLVTITHRIGVLRVREVLQYFPEASVNAAALSNTHFAYAYSVVIPLMGFVQLGLRQYVIESNVISDLCGVIERHKITQASFTPWAVTHIAYHPQVLEGYDLSSLKVASTGGQAVRMDVQSLIKKHMNLQVFTVFYGSTEACSPLAAVPGGTSEASGRLRHEKDIHVKLVDEHGKEVPQGEAGELWAKHPMLAKGYYNDPVKTAEAFDEDGYYHTSDIFRMNDKEEFFFLGRKSDTIKTQHKYFSPRYIEDVIMSYDGIKECAVVGAFSTKHAFEFPRAYIVLQDNTISATGSLDEWVTAFTDYVNEHVPEKLMRLDGGVEVLKELPRTSVGKVNLFSLRALAQQAIEQRMQ